MKKNIAFIPFLVVSLTSCGATDTNKEEQKLDPVYSYVFNADSPIKLTNGSSENTYTVSDLSFKAGDSIKFVDSSTDPYKLVENISITGERFDFSFSDGAFKSSLVGMFSFTLTISDDANKLSISKKEEESNKYTVSFDINGHGGAIDSIANVVEGSKISKPTDPSASGYIFEGWYKESSCVNLWNFDVDTVNANTTLYAKWSKIINKYTVTFDMNGYGSAINPITNVVEGSKISKPADPSATDHVFEGWYKESSCLNAWNFDVDTVNANTTLYAKWSKIINKYTVTFDMNGYGSVINPITNVVEGSKISKPTDPSASGYIFGGWYKESSCLNAWNFDVDTVNANTTLYAKWSLVAVEKYTVTFDTQGIGVSPANQIIEKGNKVIKPDDPVEEGFQFVGWYKEKTCKNVWNFNVDKVTSNITLYAKWEEEFERYFVVFNTSNVPYDLNDGVELTRKSATSYSVSLSKDVIQPGLKIKFKDSKDNVYTCFNLESNAFEEYLVKKVSDSIQFIAYGEYSLTFNPENLTSGISVTCKSKEAHYLYEVNMNSSYWFNLNFDSSTEEKVTYKLNGYTFGKNYSYSIRTNNGTDSIFENIVFSSTTNTKRFVLNGTSFTYTAQGEVGRNYSYNLTLSIYLEDLSIELDIRTA